MGMSIDESINGIEKRILPIFDNDADHKSLVKAIDTMRKYQMFQAKYVERLNADLMAMLTEIQLEIEEKFNDRPFSYNHHQRTEFYRDIDEIVQQKINSLKEDKDGENNN